MHTIRLTGPWEYEPLSRADHTASEPLDTAPLPTSGHIQIPADWGNVLGQDFRGQVRFRRRFGRPTGTWARLWLVFDVIRGAAEIRLGERLLGRVMAADVAARFDVTTLLAERNELVVEITQAKDAPLPGGLPGEVRLEIMPAPNDQGA